MADGVHVKNPCTYCKVADDFHIMDLEAAATVHFRRLLWLNRKWRRERENVSKLGKRIAFMEIEFSLFWFVYNVCAFENKLNVKFGSLYQRKFMPNAIVYCVTQFSFLISMPQCFDATYIQRMNGRHSRTKLSSWFGWSRNQSTSVFLCRKIIFIAERDQLDLISTVNSDWKSHISQFTSLIFKYTQFLAPGAVTKRNLCFATANDSPFHNR